MFHTANGISDLSFAPDDDIRSTTLQPITRANRDTGERELVAAKLGFIPSWHKSAEKFPPTTFNARAEGIERLAFGAMRLPGTGA
ncbi:SOS response-associated peptidase family protein [Terriglobus sp.]|uniref:SOS response-associated peptidase family protein n=1 Tax=Terriglobus sp. TaxID=1889013 RepID=UPI003B001796